MKEGLQPWKRTSAAAESIENLDDRAKSVVERMNLAELESIFQEEQRQSGVEPKKLDATIAYIKEGRSRGQWHRNKNQVDVNARIVDKVIGMQQEEGMSVDFESGIVSLLMHEYSHAASHSTHTEFSGLDALKSYFSKPRTVGEDGYGKVDLQSGELVGRFFLFNEGVTDLLAEEVFDEYKRRTADATLHGQEYSPGYLGQRALLEAFMLHIGDATGVGKDEVWKAIKQGYFSGLDLESNELGELYDEYALSEMMSRIKDINDELDEDTVPLIKELYTRSVFAPIDEPSRKRIMLGLERLQRTP